MASSGCAASSTSGTARPGAAPPGATTSAEGPDSKPAGGDKVSPRPAGAEADAAYYQSRAATLDKEMPEEVGRTDFVRLRRGRLYFRDGIDPQAVDPLQDRLTETFQKKDAAGVLEVTAAILKHDQADIRAHMLRAHMLRSMNQSDPADFHLAVAVGLLDSIAQSGDGRETKSAYKVYRVKEEYEVLKAIGCLPRGQTLLSEGGRAFDRLEAQNIKSGETLQLFFDVSESLAERGRRMVERLQER
jgi:hypothetical protein